MTAYNPWLIAAGSLSIAAGIAHLACIAGGPDWYRFFGAGEGIAQAAERGSWTPALLTAGIAAVLGLWGAYALAGAGVIGRLPMMRVALVAITAIYLARGLVILYPPALRRPDLTASFILWSSLIVLGIGIVHAIGTWTAWNRLSAGETEYALDA